MIAHMTSCQICHTIELWQSKNFQEFVEPHKNGVPHWVVLSILGNCNTHTTLFRMKSIVHWMQLSNLSIQEHCHGRGQLRPHCGTRQICCFIHEKSSFGTKWRWQASKRKKVTSNGWFTQGNGRSNECKQPASGPKAECPCCRQNRIVKTQRFLQRLASSR